MAIINFDSTDVDISDTYEPIPAGQYTMAVTESDVRETSNNPNNKFLKLTFDILEGEFKGRKIFENLNLWRDGSKSTDAVTLKIANENLAKLCRALGVIGVGDSTELHNKPVGVSIKVEPEKNGYPASNSVIGYDPLVTPGKPKKAVPKPTAAVKPETIKMDNTPPPMPWDKK